MTILNIISAIVGITLLSIIIVNVIDAIIAVKDQKKRIEIAKRTFRRFSKAR